MFIRKCLLGLAFTATFMAAGLAEPPNAAAALAQFAKTGQTCFVVFYKAHDNAMANMLQAATAAAEQLKGGAEVVAIDVDNQVDSDVVNRFGAGNAALPLAMSVASNGVVTRVFTESATPQALVDSVVCKQEASLIKALRDGKIVLVSVQNGKSEGAVLASKGIAAFLGEKRLAGLAESFVVDPADKAATAFLSRLEVDAGSKAAVTVLIVPPGRTAGVYVGAVDSVHLFADLAKAIEDATCDTDGGK